MLALAPVGFFIDLCGRRARIATVSHDNDDDEKRRVAPEAHADHQYDALDLDGAPNGVLPMWTGGQSVQRQTPRREQQVILLRERALQSPVAIAVCRGQTSR